MAGVVFAFGADTLSFLFVTACLVLMKTKKTAVRDETDGAVSKA